MESYPEFSSPPWKVLDGKQHLDLIANLLLSQGNPAAAANATPIQREQARRGAIDFVERGDVVQVWRTHLLSHFGVDGERPAPPGPQVVVQLIFKSNDKGPPPECSVFNLQEWVRMTFIANSEMTGPELRVTTGAAYVLMTHQPMLYRGKVLFIGKSDVFEDIPGIGLRGGMCLFKRSTEGQEKQTWHLTGNR